MTPPPSDDPAAAAGPAAPHAHLPHEAGQALDAATRSLRTAGIEQPRRDARLLLAHALALTPGEVFARPERSLSAEEAARFAGLVARRAAREPVSRIFGTREFWGLPFRLSPETLDPRPDSETLVEAALARIPDRAAPLRVLDLGTGTGCLLLALLSELPAATGVGLDRAQGAVATAAGNAAALGLAARAEMRHGDWSAPGWTDALGGPFHLILANPPYVEADAALAPEVAEHDPPAALFAGPDGLEAYRHLLPALPGLLAPGGWALLEIGAGQAAAVAGLAEPGLWREIDRLPDLSGTPRCVALRR